MDSYLVFIPWICLGLLSCLGLFIGKAAAMIGRHVQRMTARRDLYRNMKRYYRTTF